MSAQYPYPQPRGGRHRPSATQPQPRKKDEDTQPSTLWLALFTPGGRKASSLAIIVIMLIVSTAYHSSYFDGMRGDTTRPANVPYSQVR